MATTAAITTSKTRLPASFLSVLGGVIVSAGFFYPCLFVILREPCRARFCHFGIMHRGILSGWQILAINARPAAPPFIRIIAAPPGLISLVPLAMGGIALLLSIISLLQSPRWLLLLTLGIVAIGLLVLVYDTALLNGGVNIYDGGYIVITAFPSLALAGQAFLYFGYLLLVLGIAQMLRRNKETSLAA